MLFSKIKIHRESNKGKNKNELPLTSTFFRDVFRTISTSFGSSERGGFLPKTQRITSVYAEGRNLQESRLDMDMDLEKNGSIEISQNEGWGRRIVLPERKERRKRRDLRWRAWPRVGSLFTTESEEEEDDDGDGDDDDEHLSLPEF